MNVNYLSVGTPKRLLSGLKAYWKCDETTGTTLFDSHNDYDLTVGGSGYSVGVEPGKIATYGYKNAQNSYAYWATETDFSPFFQAFTWAMWIYWNELPSVSGYTSNVMSIGTSTSCQILTAGTTTDRCTGRMYLSNGGNYAVVGNDAFSVSQWYHIAFVSPGNGTPLRYYRNGAQNESSAQTPVTTFPAATPTMNFELGNAPGAHTIGPKCVFSEVGIWHRELMDADITLLYNGGTGITYPF